MKTIEERKNRIIARGEVSGHSHIITGECTLERTASSVIIHAGRNCAIKHLLEKEFIQEGVEIWTKEHLDIPIQEGESLEFVQQIEYDPYSKLIQQVKD
jgi:hypothetical protein